MVLPDASPDADAGPGGPSTPLPPAPVESPEPPADAAVVDMGPCPMGWETTRSEREGGATWCVPTGAAFAACDPGGVRVPGEDACTPLASCTTSDGFPDDLPAGGTLLFVRPGATSGDGSRGSPFGTLTEALTDATDGTTIALSVGTHTGGVTLPAGVSLVGVCPEQTILTAPSDVATLNVDGTGASVQSVSIEGGATSLAVGAAGSLTMRTSEVRGISRSKVR